MFSILKITLIVLAIVYSCTEAAKVKLCVDNAKSLEKCQAMGDALRVQKADKNPDFECISNDKCIDAVTDESADATIVDADEHPNVLKKLEAVLFESYDDSNLIVALIDADKVNQLNDLPLSYDKKDIRLFHSALYINYYRNGRKCERVVRPNKGSQIILERYHEIKDSKKKKLVCIENEKLVIKSISEFKNCHVEANIPNAVMIKKGASNKNDVIEAFLTAANKVGLGRQFQLFGPFKGTSNLIFRDETKTLERVHSKPNGISVDKFLDLHCGSTENHGHAHDHEHDHDGDHHHHH
ncbi:transferrin-like [Condylostylus longicornis]|uniref:transferrin-like n=1 Tax=Condylostylus longicornis TaxID=2530218 RepID=UPI00244E4D1A|nr:transferrin-like [Condylostylus longicornis]